jgi:Uncharacterised protein family (UPF0149)
LVAYPLTETEIGQLDDFLISDSVPEEAMDLSMMDGFITALASGPNPDDAELDVEIDLGPGAWRRRANVRERRRIGEHYHFDHSALE